jgi:ribonuclease T1
MNLGWMRIFCRVRLLSLLALVFSILSVLVPATAVAYSHHGNADGVMHEVALSALPMEAKDTLRRIRQGGPFQYPRDGVVFGNFEKRLPKKQRGYYHEYTVKTPGVHSRGARRIVCGQSSECYYSDDHYQTFKLIRE